MNKIIAILLLLSFFACKKEENSNVNNVPAFDSIIYYNKWTKMNKVQNFIDQDITDVSYQKNKSMALLSNFRVYFIDSNFKMNTSPDFISWLGNRNTRFRTDPDFPNEKSAFYYVTGADSSPRNAIRLVMMNYIYGPQLKSQLYTLSYFIKDTNQTGKYLFLGYGHDYFAYCYNNHPNEYSYKLHYFNSTEKIDTVFSFAPNTYFNTTFRLADNVVFWNYSDNEFTTINTQSLMVKINQSLSKDLRFIGTFNNYAYFFNKLAHVIYKTKDLSEFELVYEYKWLIKTLPFFDEKYLLISRFKDTNDDNTVIEELALLNLENKTAKILPMPSDRYVDIKCNWVIDNTLYILTSTDIYARKF